MRIVVHATLVALAASHSSPLLAQGPKTSLTIVRAKGAEITMQQPTVEVYSDRGYISGGSFQGYYVLLLTDTVTPPEGMTLTPTALSWDSLSSIEWLSSSKTAPPRQGLVRLTFRSGRTDTGLLWVEMRDGPSPLYSCGLRIKGTIVLGGKEQAAALGQGESTARFCKEETLTSIRVNP